MDRIEATWQTGCFGKNGCSSGSPPSKMEVHPQTFVQIILAAIWLVRHSNTSPKQRAFAFSFVFILLLCPGIWHWVMEHSPCTVLTGARATILAVLLIVGVLTGARATILAVLPLVSHHHPLGINLQNHSTMVLYHIYDISAVILAGLGTPFFSVQNIPFFCVLKKERYVLFRSFLEFLATYETQKNVTFFSLLF